MQCPRNVNSRPRLRRGAPCASRSSSWRETASPWTASSARPGRSSPSSSGKISAPKSSPSASGGTAPASARRASSTSAEAWSSGSGVPPDRRSARRLLARSRSRATDYSALARLAVRGVLPAPLAVLAQPDAIRVVALGLVGLVVPALALLAREGDGDPDVSAGHACGAPSEERVEGNRRRAKENPAPARGRQRRIASPDMPPLPEVPGVRHAEHALPTGVTLHVAEAGDPAAPAVL